VPCFVFFWWWYLGLNSGIGTCKMGSTPCDPHLNSILLWLFWKWGLVNYFPGLVPHLYPSTLSLSISYDYRCEPLCAWSALGSNTSRPKSSSVQLYSAPIRNCEVTTKWRILKLLKPTRNCQLTEVLSTGMI
jgi:hypothetical protein